MGTSGKKAAPREGEKSSGRPRPRDWRVVIGCGWLCAGLVLLTGGLSAAAVHYPRSYRALHAYEHAERCPALVRQPADCVSDLDATVEHIEVGRIKGSKYVQGVTVTGQAGSAGDIQFADGAFGLLSLRPGDHLTVKVWRGRRVLLATRDRTQATAETPVGVPLGWLSLGVASCLLGLVAFDYAARYLSGRLHTRWNASGQSISAEGKALTGAAVLALLAAFLPTSSREPTPGHFFLPWILGMALVGAAALAIRRYRR
jgi:hypothetical protein